MSRESWGWGWAWGHRACLLIWIAAAACSRETSRPDPDPDPKPDASAPIELPPPLPPLAPVQPTKTERFTTSGACAQCHFAGESAAMRDADGNDVSPVLLWRSSMMAFAARDPYYLAVFSQEIANHPDAVTKVEKTCTRCHAPAASAEHEQVGGHESFNALTAGIDPADHLGRDGVTCTLCHQITSQGLGKTESFGGGFTVGFAREIFGPHAGPKTDPMQFFVEFTPKQADHVATSELCATCHTVIVPILGPKGSKVGDFLEQAPYLEWLSSDYAAGQPCGACHLPTRDAHDAPIETPIAKYPAGLAARQPFGQHGFVGANAYMLGVLADNVSWTGSDVAASELLAAADRSAQHLAGAATIAVLSATPAGTGLSVVLEVKNRTGHKLPTGLPSRRAWIHLRAEDAGGQAIFESGAFDASGAIIDGAGHRIDEAGKVLPHRDEITSEGQAQVYEAIAADANEEPTHLALEATHMVKDNRLLPSGWAPVAAWSDALAPVGTGGDATFGAGGDRVTYKIPEASKIKRIVVELVYQSVPPATLDRLAVVPTPAAVRFSQMAAKRPPVPVVLAKTTFDL